MFLSILEELLVEQNNNTRKSLWQEILQKATNRNRNSRTGRAPLIETDVIKWHYDRFLMFSRLKDDVQATVGDLRKFVAQNPHSKLKLGFSNSIGYLTPYITA